MTNDERRRKVVSLMTRAGIRELEANYWIDGGGGGEIDYLCCRDKDNKPVAMEGSDLYDLEDAAWSMLYDLRQYGEERSGSLCVNLDDQTAYTSGQVQTWTDDFNSLHFEWGEDATP